MIQLFFAYLLKKTLDVSLFFWYRDIVWKAYDRVFTF